MYARYSTDRQNPKSVDDQIHLCIGRIRELGGEPVATYADRGITGEFAILRPALQRLLRDALDGRFDVVVAEALDRISRSQADTAAIHRRLEFRGVRIHTLSEGSVGPLHIGLRGTMNELFLADLRAKVRRGMEGSLRRGRIGGRIPYPIFTTYFKIDIHIMGLRCPGSSSGTTSVRFGSVQTTVLRVPPGA